MAESGTAKTSVVSGAGAAGDGAGGGAAVAKAGGLGAANGMGAGDGGFGDIEGNGEAPGGLVKAEAGNGGLPGGLATVKGVAGRGAAAGGAAAGAGGFGREEGSAWVVGCRVKCEAAVSATAGFGAGGAVGKETGFGATVAGGIGITGAGAGGGGGGGSGAIPEAGVTAALSLNAAFLPKILVTLSGTNVTRWPGRRAKSAGSMEERINGNGRGTMVASCVASSLKASGGEPLRNWPKEIFTEPEANCANAVLDGREKLPPPAGAASAAKLDGRAAIMAARGRLIIVSGAAGADISTGGGAGAALGCAAGDGAEALASGLAGGGADGTRGGSGSAGFEKILLKAPNMEIAFRQIGGDSRASRDNSTNNKKPPATRAHGSPGKLACPAPRFAQNELLPEPARRVRLKASGGAS
jgi:hypothetical protein